jgi:hypothetical protein
MCLAGPGAIQKSIDVGNSGRDRRHSRHWLSLPNWSMLTDAVEKGKMN